MGHELAEDPSYKSIILEFKDIDKFPSTGMWKRAFCTKYRNIARYLSTLSSIVIEDLTKRSRFECPVPPWLRSNTFLFTLVFKKREGLQNGQFVGQSFFSLLKIGTRSGFLRAEGRGDDVCAAHQRTGRRVWTRAHHGTGLHRVRVGIRGLRARLSAGCFPCALPAPTLLPPLLPPGLLTHPPCAGWLRRPHPRVRDARH